MGTPGSGTPDGRAQLLRQHRRERGLSQEQLADLAGLSARGVQDLERGLAVPRRETLVRLIGALGLQGEPRATFEAAAKPRPRRRQQPTTGPDVAQRRIETDTGSVAPPNDRSFSLALMLSGFAPYVVQEFVTPRRAPWQRRGRAPNRRRTRVRITLTRKRL